MARILHMPRTPALLLVVDGDAGVITRGLAVESVTANPEAGYPISPVSGRDHYTIEAALVDIEEVLGAMPPDRRRLMARFLSLAGPPQPAPSDEGQLLAELDDVPRVTLLGLADLAEEGGDLALAEGYRWLAAKEASPVRHPFASCWTWLQGEPPGEHAGGLPPEVWVTLPDNGGVPWFARRQDAFRGAALALGRWLRGR
jgi:hypothetical protein